MFTTNYQKVLFVLVALSVVLRFFSFFPSVIDHDESTYLVIANEMLHHKTLYTDLIDIKPPGIFLLYALQLWLVKSVFFTRFITALVVAATAYCLYITKRQQTPNNSQSAFATGVIYVFLCSTFTFYGVSPNTELYFNAFTALALVLFNKQSLKYYFFGGLMMGIGFIIKYMVLLDFTAFMLWAFVAMLLAGVSLPKAIGQMFVRASLAFVGLLLPLAACHLYYYLTNNFDAYYFITYIAPKRYANTWQPLHMAQLIGDYYLRFLPISFFFFYTLFQSKSPKNERLFALIWTFLSLIAVTLPSNRFGHYTIQLMLPTAYLAGSFFGADAVRPKWANVVLQKNIAYPLLALIIGIIVYLQKHDCYDKPDIPQQTANYLNAHLQPTETLYTGNTQHIVYLLTNQRSPIAYVHRNLIFDKKHIRSIAIDTTAQINRLIALQPTYILQQDTLPNKRLQQFVQQQYTLVQTIDNKVQIFRRMD